ncbi:MAG TPA: phosphomannomutase/phosphoglucomutase [Thermomicrobiales bacterium]|nr:phosphomannomutase/phosphoglucomutase [Thermomicrobiales bacterium]
MPTSDLSAIFKAYDVRGVVPGELDAETAYKIGRAFAAYIGGERYCVGRDMRLSSPELAEGIIRGIVDQGGDVVDIGMISTDGLYFAVGKYGFDGGCMVTASHNPAEYNGFKLCRSEARPLSMDQGIGEVRDMVLSDEFPEPSRRGSVTQRDVLDDFVTHALSMIDTSVLRPMKIAVDAGNGMAGKLVPPVFERIPGELIPLYFELDGSFPNHEANPLEPQNIVDLQRTVREQGADLGVAFDGDADRMFLIDENGAFVGGDMVTAMVAKVLLAKHPGAAVVYNLICSRSVPETILAAGGKPIRSRVGHSFIKALMREHDAIFGGEHSGHFYFRDNWYADSGLIAFLTVLELLSREGKTLSQTLEPIDTRTRSGEINFEVQDQAAALERIKAAFADAEIDELDGLTVGYEDWWFNIRASNTQPLLRLNVEVEDAATLDDRVRAISKLIEG